MEIVECQGFSLSREMAAVVERDGIDVGVIAAQLELEPIERLKRSIEAAEFISFLQSTGETLRNEGKLV